MYDEHVRTPSTLVALGANLAGSNVEQHPDALRVRLELFDTVRGRLVATRTVEGPVSVFTFVERTYREAAAMLHRKPRGDIRSELWDSWCRDPRFYLQGIWRMWR
jgi:hypothetical protein